MTVSPKDVSIPQELYNDVLTHASKVSGNIIIIDDEILHTLIEKYSPSLGARAVHLGKALGRKFSQAIQGKPTTVNPEELNRRLSLCFGCHYLKGSFCLHSNCGCAVSRKALWSTESCPIRRW